MLCQDCGQRVATVIYTEVREGRKEVLHLCQGCVEKRGVPTPVLKNPLHVDLIFRDILEQITEENQVPEGGHPLDAVACPRCGWTFREFRESGLLGCPTCYASFAEPLREILRRVHGSEEHLGKTYTGAHALPAEEDPALLRSALEEAVRSEAFEEAAELRDRLRRLDDPGPTAGTGEGAE